ncbi:MAG: hypothetical protein LUC35_02320 [Clostridiales bacterium]|nr:hypothetical protein [Clostridiales bacterium]MCD8334193.1 hypothetical protein [Clostridiales bacterium]
MPCPNCGGCGKPAPLTEPERRMLDLLAQNAFLPVARFLLRSPEDPELSFVMSAPVYLDRPEATQQELRTAGTALLQLQRRGFVTLDYGVPLTGFDYTAWERSALYRQFAQAAAAPGTEPQLEPGSAALTLQGQEALDEM